MKVIYKFLTLAITMIFFLGLFSFFGDGALFFLATNEDKTYGDNNKYIDNTLTGEELTQNNNLKDSYKFSNDTNKIGLNFMKFFIIAIKIFFMLLLPLLLYFLFINKDNNILTLFEKAFKKE